MSAPKKKTKLGGEQQPPEIEQQLQQQQLSPMMFGLELPAIPTEAVKTILSYLSIGNIYHCYQIGHPSWIKITEQIMAERSKDTENRFTCGCVGLYPKILGKYIDLENVTEVCASWSSREPLDARLLAHLPNLQYYRDPRIDGSQLDVNVDRQKLAGYCMRMLGTHSSLLKECDLGHQVWDSEFTTEDAITLLQGCPDLEQLESQNGFQLLWGDSNLLNALKTGPYENLSVPIKLHNPYRDMNDIIGGFVDNPGQFCGTLTTFPYCWDEHWDEHQEVGNNELEAINAEFNAESAALMRRATFSLYIEDIDWYP